MSVLAKEWQFIKEMWANGGKPLVLASIYFFGGLFILAAAIVFTLFNRDADYSPLNYKNPQAVLSPVVQQGGTLIVDAYKCNDTDKPVAVEGASYWRNLDTQELTLKSATAGAIRDPGCPLLHYENAVPADLPPGRYQLEGVEKTLDGNRVQGAAWRTEEFVVIEREPNE